LPALSTPAAKYPWRENLVINKTHALALLLETTTNPLNTVVLITARSLSAVRCYAMLDEAERSQRVACAQIRRVENNMRAIDRAFAVLLFVGAILHAYGSFSGYSIGSETLVWSLSGSLAAILLAVLNFLRAGRAEDRALAWITFAGSVGWVAVALGFGAAIGNVLDPRVLWHAISAGVLAAFSLTTAVKTQVV
jgi:hypothetical protein